MSEKSEKLNEILAGIKESILHIAGTEPDSPVYLEGASFFETRKSRSGSGTFIVNCVFINDDGILCADMHRSGTGGCVDFICGYPISDIDEKGLNEILRALDEKRFSSPDSEKIVKKRRGERKFFAGNIRLPFILKGA